MRKFLIATHGSFAKGFKESLELITGKRDDIAVINAYTDDTPLADSAKKVLDTVGQDDELIIFTDVMFGSVNQFFTKYITLPNIHVISGFNLPLALEMITCAPDQDLVSAIDDFVKAGKEQIVYINKYKVAFDEED